MLKHFCFWKKKVILKRVGNFVGLQQKKNNNNNNKQNTSVTAGKWNSVLIVATPTCPGSVRIVPG